MRTLSPLFVSLLLSACATGDSDKVEVIAACGDPCALSDDQNFSYSSSMEAEVIDARAGADITIDWLLLTDDILGHTVDPTTDIDQVMLVNFPRLEPEEVLDGLANDSLDQAEVGGYFTNEPESASCQLAQFGLLGAIPHVEEYFLEDSGTWLFALKTDGVTGVRSLVFGNPVTDHDNVLISIGNDTAKLNFEVDLTSANAVGIPAGTTPVLDWSGLSVDGVGSAIELEKIDLLQVARYDLSLSEMEDGFFDLPTLAAETWSLDVEGVTSASLADLAGDTPFVGIDDSGTWELALWCTTCQNPVPKVLAHLAIPTEGG